MPLASKQPVSSHPFPFLIQLCSPLEKTVDVANRLCCVHEVGTFFN